jgi:response regulator RpfG family c-di-GMP phosphodiesterase
MDEISILKGEIKSAFLKEDRALIENIFDKLLGKYQRNITRLERIIKQSDKQQALVLKLNEELDEYKDHLENKIEEATKDIINLNKEIEDTQKEVIFRMGAIGETRSKETGNHVKRVAEYSKLLALYYGLGEDEAELLKQVSPMHDIGKVGIPDNILNKPGKFTDKEFEIMKQHSKIGYDMLSGTDKPLLKAASIVAYEHHEKWSGGGYPRGIKGEEIHIFGRITALADVFDALGSDRCYKKKWDDEKIFTLFKEERGRHFEPKLVDIFFENLDQFLKVRDDFKDI